MVRTTHSTQEHQNLINSQTADLLPKHETKVGKLIGAIVSSMLIGNAYGVLAWHHTWLCNIYSVMLMGNLFLRNLKPHLWVWLKVTKFHVKPCVLSTLKIKTKEKKLNLWKSKIVKCGLKDQHVVRRYGNKVYCKQYGWQFIFHSFSHLILAVIPQ